MIITLIGMPAAGKTCLGRELAARLGYDWVDGDALIEKSAGCRLQEIINRQGLETFKKKEEEVLLSVDGDRLVLSTGGSAVYYDSVMRHLASLGKIVYLKVGLDLLLKRLGDFSKRGIALRPGQTIADLYRERTELYEKYADVILDCDGDNYAEYQSDLIQALGLTEAQNTH